MIKKSITSILILLFGAATLFAGEVNMKPGQWEISTKMEMAGMPMQMPAVTHTQCITEEDLVPLTAQYQNDDCKIKNKKISGDTLSWEMECDAEDGKITGTGEVTYSGTSFNGKMIIKTPGDMTMKNTITGKRIGNCTK